MHSRDVVGRDSVMWDSAGAAASARDGVRAASAGAWAEPVSPGCPWPGVASLAGGTVSDVVRQGIRPWGGAVGAARGVTVATVRGWGMAELGDTAELVVSELVTNALSHGLAGRGGTSRGRLAVRPDVRAPVELMLMCGSRRLGCVVTDPGENVPVRGDPEDLADGGRGLNVVAACSSAWGWSRVAGGGKAVWAVFDHAP